MMWTPDTLGELPFPGMDEQVICIGVIELGCQRDGNSVCKLVQVVFWPYNK